MKKYIFLAVIISITFLFTNASLAYSTGVATNVVNGAAGGFITAGGDNTGYYMNVSMPTVPPVGYSIRFGWIKYIYNSDGTVTTEEGYTLVYTTAGQTSYSCSVHLDIGSDYYVYVQVPNSLSGWFVCEFL
jgi:hypothetical protein